MRPSSSATASMSEHGDLSLIHVSQQLCEPLLDGIDLRNGQAELHASRRKSGPVSRLQFSDGFTF